MAIAALDPPRHAAERQLAQWHAAGLPGLLGSLPVGAELDVRQCYCETGGEQGLGACVHAARFLALACVLPFLLACMLNGG